VSEAVDEDTDNRYEGGDREGLSVNTQKTSKTLFPQLSGGEKWASALDHKLGPFLGEVDIVEYGGRDVQE
jgi:hypothetical protein